MARRLEGGEADLKEMIKKYCEILRTVKTVNPQAPVDIITRHEVERWLEKQFIFAPEELDLALTQLIEEGVLGLHSLQ